MNNSIIKLLFFVFCLVMICKLSAQSTNPGKAPWDTLIAKLQIIESAKEPDSVKTILTQELFLDYDLSADDYGKFYDQFLKKPPEQQVEFLNRVEEIILEMMKVHQQKMREEFERHPPE